MSLTKDGSKLRAAFLTLAALAALAASLSACFFFSRVTNSAMSSFAAFSLDKILLYNIRSLQACVFTCSECKCVCNHPKTQARESTSRFIRVGLSVFYNSIGIKERSKGPEPHMHELIYPGVIYWPVSTDLFTFSGFTPVALTKRSSAAGSLAPVSCEGQTQA